MALLREMVEKKRQHYLNLLTEVGAITARKDTANFTLSEMEELYRKWMKTRRESEE